SYTALSLLDTFDWSSEKIKEKMSLAIMVRDVLLWPEQFAQLRDYEKSGRTLALDEEIRNHPTKTAALLEADKNRWFPPEVCTIIQQHHERPDGGGFPAGLKHTKITVLSAIGIVSDDFIT